MSIKITVKDKIYITYLGYSVTDDLMTIFGGEYMDQIVDVSEGYEIHLIDKIEV